MKILIVEEDKLLRDALVLFFRTKGVHVRSFGNAEEAVPEMQAFQPHIVICDRSLPGMDGLAFLGQVGARHREALRILIDAHPDAPFAEQARRAGIHECLPKPFAIEEIEQAMERWLRMRSSSGKPAGDLGGHSGEERAG